VSGKTRGRVHADRGAGPELAGSTLPSVRRAFTGRAKGLTHREQGEAAVADGLGEA